MELDCLIEEMAASAASIRGLVGGVSDHQARWTPDASSWSVLEVINHLLDEEREDFRVRLDIILHRPGDPWPPIDPEGWVTARRYNEQDPGVSLQAFLSAREESLAWLRELPPPDWDAECEAPWGSSIRAGDIMAAWVAHDLLHTRQLVELQWEFTMGVHIAPYRVEYAGEW